MHLDSFFVVRIYTCKIKKHEESFNSDEYACVIVTTILCNEFAIWLLRIHFHMNFTFRAEVVPKERKKYSNSQRSLCPSCGLFPSQGPQRIPVSRQFQHVAVIPATRYQMSDHVVLSPEMKSPSK